MRRRSTCLNARLSRAPSYYEAELDWGNALVDAKRPREAIEHYQAAVRLDPKAFMPHYNVANTLFALGDTAGAVADYESALRLKPNFPQAHFNLGLVFAQSGRLTEAVEQFETVLKLDPNYFAAGWNLAKAYASLQRPEEAIATAKEAVSAAQSAGNQEFVKQMEGWLAEYEAEQGKGARKP